MSTTGTESAPHATPPDPAVVDAPGGRGPSLGVPGAGALLQAELVKLGGRISFRVAVVVLLLVAVVVPVLMFGGQVVLNRATADAGATELPPQSTLAFCLMSVRLTRSFFVVKSLIVWLVAESVAGEFVSRTLREDLVRPVHRSTVLLAKWLAVQAFVLLGAVLPLSVGALLGLAFFGWTGDVQPELTEWGLAWLGDAGFAAVVMLVAVWLRSVPGTMIGVILGWIFVYGFGFALWTLQAARPFLGDYLARYNATAALMAIDTVIGLRPWLPSAAFALNGALQANAPVIWQSFAGLALYTFGSYLVADRLFARMDID